MMPAVTAVIGAEGLAGIAGGAEDQYGDFGRLQRAEIRFRVFRGVTGSAIRD